jgi:hypothetical protein
VDGQYPILEYGATLEAIIETARILKPADVPEHCIVCFLQEVLSALVEKGRARHSEVHKSEMGQHPVRDRGHRESTGSARCRERLFGLAAEACLFLS